MTEPRPIPRLLILGGDLRGNVGDRAIRAVLMNQIRRIDPRAEVFAVSRIPVRDQAEFGLQVIAPSAAALLCKPRFLRTLTASIYGGGQLLQDDSSQAKNIYWAALLHGIRRLSRAPVWGYGLGIGPLQTRTGRLFARQALRSLNGCIARDARSAAWASQGMRPGTPVAVAPDPAIALEAASRDEAIAYLSKTEKVPFRADELWIGIGIRRFFPGRHGVLPSAWTAGREPESPEFLRFKQNLAVALNRYGENRQVRVLFFPFYKSAWQDDARHAREVARQLRLPAHVLELNCPAGMVKGLQGLCDLFVGVPMHSTIFAMGAGVPTLGLAYADKMQDFFHTVQLDNLVMPVDRVGMPDGAEMLHEAISLLFNERDGIRAKLKNNWPRLGNQMPVYEEWLASILRGEKVPPSP